MLFNLDLPHFQAERIETNQRNINIVPKTNLINNNNEYDQSLKSLKSNFPKIELKRNLSNTNSENNQNLNCINGLFLPKEKNLNPPKIYYSEVIETNPISKKNENKTINLSKFSSSKNQKPSVPKILNPDSINKCGNQNLLYNDLNSSANCKQRKSNLPLQIKYSSESNNNEQKINLKSKIKLRRGSNLKISTPNKLMNTSKNFNYSKDKLDLKSPVPASLFKNQVNQNGNQSYLNNLENQVESKIVEPKQEKNIFQLPFSEQNIKNMNLYSGNFSQGNQEKQFHCDNELNSNNGKQGYSTQYNNNYDNKYNNFEVPNFCEIKSDLNLNQINFNRNKFQEIPNKNNIIQSNQTNNNDNMSNFNLNSINRAIFNIATDNEDSKTRKEFNNSKHPSKVEKNYSECNSESSYINSKIIQNVPFNCYQNNYNSEMFNGMNNIQTSNMQYPQNNSNCFPYKIEANQFTNTPLPTMYLNQNNNGNFANQQFQVSNNYNNYNQPFITDQKLGNQNSTEYFPFNSNKEGCLNTNSNQIINSSYDIKTEYLFNDNSNIGKGSFGIVRKAIHKITNKEYAIKEIPFEILNLSPIMLKQQENELEVVKILNHPNVIRTYEINKSNSNWYIVMDLLKGNDLLFRIRSMIGNEGLVSFTMEKILRGLAYCHSLGIVHRDIKLENILFERAEIDSNLKIIDFGLATIISSGETLKEITGSPLYMPPEMLNQLPYNHNCDIWSCGIIAYLLISGRLPYENTDDTQNLYSQIRNIKFNFDHFNAPIWYSISQNAKMFILSMLEPNPEKRWTAQQLLSHQFIKTYTESNVSIPLKSMPNLPENLINFQKASFAQKLIKTIIAFSFDSNKYLKIIYQQFTSTDSNGDGKLSFEEYRNFLSKIKETTYFDIDPEFSFKKIDTNKNGSIEFAEFIPALLNDQLFEDHNALETAFRLIDIEKKGFITLIDFKRFISGSDEEVKNSLNNISQDLFSSLQKDRMTKDQFISAIMRTLHPVSQIYNKY